MMPNVRKRMEDRKPIMTGPMPVSDMMAADMMEGVILWKGMRR